MGLVHWMSVRNSERDVAALKGFADLLVDVMSVNLFSAAVSCLQKACELYGFLESYACYHSDYNTCARTVCQAEVVGVRRWRPKVVMAELRVETSWPHQTSRRVS